MWHRTKSDAPVIQQVETDIRAPALQLPLPLLRGELLLCRPLCYVLPARHEALSHFPHKLHTPRSRCTLQLFVSAVMLVHWTLCFIYLRCGSGPDVLHSCPSERLICPY